MLMLLLSESVDESHRSLDLGVSYCKSENERLVSN